MLGVLGVLECNLQMVYMVSLFFCTKVMAMDVVTFLMEPIVQVPIVDMPVDPNEPTYCLCQQVSYGEMIG